MAYLRPIHDLPRTCTSFENERSHPVVALTQGFPRDRKKNEDMSEKGKKPGTRDISDLKARLGLKRGGDKAAGGAVPPPSAGKGTGYVPPPPGVTPPQPAVPDARVDPFGAMNAMAAQGAIRR